MRIYVKIDGYNQIYDVYGTVVCDNNDILLRVKDCGFTVLFMLLAFGLTTIISLELGLSDSMSIILSFISAICTWYIYNQHKDKKRTNKVKYANSFNFTHFQVIQQQMKLPISLTNEDAKLITEIIDNGNHAMQKMYFDNKLFKIDGLEYLYDDEFVMYFFNSYIEEEIFQSVFALRENGIIESSHFEHGKHFYTLTTKGLAYYKSKSDAYHTNFRQATIEKTKRITKSIENRI